MCSFDAAAVLSLDFIINQNFSVAMGGILGATRERTFAQTYTHILCVKHI